MSSGFDAIVIGSGFGGAVMACRLAEKGLRVLVLERGKRWHPGNLPSETGDWIYDPERPEKHSGWADIRLYKHMGIAAGAAVGGGSLIYANVSVKAPRQIFDAGWPKEITYDDLLPHYDEVGKMLALCEIPANQETKRSQLMREAADVLGYGDRFKKVELAVSFDDDYDPSRLENYRDVAHSKKFTNAFGKEQGTCIHLGDCDVGCKVLAKNTLDLNYLAVAEAKGAEVRELHLVRTLEPVDGGYRVHFDRVENGQKFPGSVTAARVILAAGSVGSTELLLRCRDQFKTLPRLSDRLGLGWSSNGDFLTPAFYKGRDVDPTMGPTITAVIDFLDGKESGGEKFWVQEGGLPPVLTDWITRKLDGGARGRIRLVLEHLREHLQNDGPIDTLMPWFGQGIDRANGRFFVKRKWWAPWRWDLRLDWHPSDAEGAINGLMNMHVKLTEATGGKAVEPPTWTKLRWLITPHPLGGCNMGDDAGTGVVDHRCRVFGYDNLWVADGAVLPEAVGRNPSRTIAAVAERAASLVEG